MLQTSALKGLIKLKRIDIEGNMLFVIRTTSYDCKMKGYSIESISLLKTKNMPYSYDEKVNCSGNRRFCSEIFEHCNGVPSSCKRNLKYSAFFSPNNMCFKIIQRKNQLNQTEVKTSKTTFKGMTQIHKRRIEFLSKRQRKGIHSDIDRDHMG